MTAINFRRPIVTLQGRIVNGNQQFTRDRAITVSARFYDTRGNTVTPSSATLTLSYVAAFDCRRTHTDYALTNSGGVWSYTWDSTIAEEGQISGHIATADKAYAVDFDFRLLKNPANRRVAPTAPALTATASFSCSGASAVAFVGRNSSAFFILLHNNSDHILLRSGSGARLLRGH
jgi:hypothetical protein